MEAKRRVVHLPSSLYRRNPRTPRPPCDFSRPPAGSGRPLSSTTWARSPCHRVIFHPFWDSKEQDATTTRRRCVLRRDSVERFDDRRRAIRVGRRPTAASIFSRLRVTVRRAPRDIASLHLLTSISGESTWKPTTTSVRKKMDKTFTINVDE